jgi:predicted short-subunit dehydrogenase-like oxidoreductase (DUF2520 family)
MGTALAHALTAAGVRVEVVASRTSGHAEALAAALPHARAVELREAGSAVPTVLLTVSDSAIEAACAAIEVAAGALVAHASGSRDVAPLEPARRRGALVGGIHPLAAVARGAPQALSRETCIAAFQGAAFAIEGDDEVQARLGSLAIALGGHPWTIHGADKARYHLGASMLAAFSAGLAQITWDGMRAAGASERRASLGVGHLLETVAGNIARAPTPESAKTGPVARGDAAAVVRQVETAHTLSPEGLDVYVAHVAHDIHLAQSAGRIDEAAAQVLRDALAQFRKG